MALILALSAPAPAQAPLRGRVEQHSFIGPVLGNTVLFNIYLPREYDSGAARFPVIYYLHGLDGSQGGPSNVVVPRSFEQAQDAGIIGPVIIVFANGYLDSLWADSIDGTKPAETDVIRQLVPHVDANFRTLGTPCARAIIGFSMGGFGAPKFYTKFPEHFAACIAYDGSFADWEILLKIRPEWAAGTFGGSEAYFDQFSPWYWASAHAATLRARADIRMVVGSGLPSNRAYRDHLLALAIPVNYIETGCPHDMVCMLNAQGLASAAFLASRLSPPPPGDASRDGAVGLDDIAAVINSWAQNSPPAPAEVDLDQSGDIGLGDIAVVLNHWGAMCP